MAARLVARERVHAFLHEFWFFPSAPVSASVFPLGRGLFLLVLLLAPRGAPFSIVPCGRGGGSGAAAAAPPVVVLRWARGLLEPLAVRAAVGPVAPVEAAAAEEAVAHVARVDGAIHAEAEDLLRPGRAARRAAGER